MDINSFSNIKELKYSDPSGLSIDFIADIDGVGDSLKFTASSGDTESYGRELYAMAEDGNYGVVSPFIPHVKSQSEIEYQSRQIRDAFIYATDRMTIIDFSINDLPVSEEQRQEVFDVRAAFRA